MAKMVERDPDWIGRAPLHVSNTRRIDASPDAVWERIADHPGWTEWLTDLKRVEVTLGATGVGGGRVVSAPLVKISERFTAWDPGQRFAFTATDGPYPLLSLAEMVTIEPDGDGCTVTYQQGLEGRRWFGLIAKLVARKLDSSTRAALGRLADLVTA